MTRLRDDEKLAKVARVLREGRDRLVEYVHAVQEVTWELAVRAALRGDLGLQKRCIEKVKCLRH